MRTLLSLDVGTTAVKVGLFREDLTSLGIVIEEYTLSTPEPDYVEMEPEVYWQSACKGIRKVLADSGTDPGTVAAITCTTQGETLIPVDAQGRVLHPAIVWLDARAKEEADFLSERFTAEQFYQVTGLPEISAYCPIAKLKWLKDRKPQVYGAMHKALFLEDYLIYRFTGQFVTNPALTCSGGFFDIRKGVYWQEILRCCDLDEAKLPEVRPCGTVVGGVLPEVAQALGLSAEAVVSTGAMDQVAAAVGCGNVREDVVTDTVGTCQVIAATAGPEMLEKWSPVTVYSHAVEGKYLLMMINQTAGMILKWFRNEFAKDIMEQYGAAAFDKLSELAAAAPPLANGLVLFPHLAGIQGAVNDPDARGAFVGVGLDTDRGCFVRAIMEGVAYMSRESIEVMKLEPASLISLGGGAKSTVWNQIKADVYNKPVLTLSFEEAALLGAAILGGVACGIFGSMEQACGLVGTKDTFRPGAANAKCYEGGYRRYLKMYDCLSPLFGRPQG